MEDPNPGSSQSDFEDYLQTPEEEPSVLTGQKMTKYWHDVVAAGAAYKTKVDVSAEDQAELQEMAKELSKIATGSGSIPNIAAATLNPARAKDKSKPKYLVAFNVVNYTALQKYIDQTYKDPEAAKKDFEVVLGDPKVGPPNLYDYHAEMRILDHLNATGELNESLRERPKHFIGISMPCCDKCGTCLAISGVAYEGGHGKAYGKWRAPRAVTSDPKRLTRFLGSEDNYAMFKHMVATDKDPSVVMDTVIKTAESYEWTAKVESQRNSVRQWAPNEAAFLKQRDKKKVDPESIKYNNLRESQLGRLDEFRYEKYATQTGFDVRDGAPFNDDLVKIYDQQVKDLRSSDYGTWVEDDLSDKEEEIKEKKRKKELEAQSKKKKVKKQGKSSREFDEF